MICPLCKDEIPKKFDCRFCHGKENLDWIENLLGVEYTHELAMNQGISKNAYQISKDIDRQILKKLLEESEKYTKRKVQ